MMDSVLPAAMPCDDCTLLYADSGLEYADGREANVNNGVVQHHTIMINMGTDHVWEGCGMPFSPPGFDPFFGGGNERTLVHYKGDNFNSGYYISPNDSFILYNELMNMDVEEKHIYATINWEYLPGKPEGFKRVQDMWLDLSYCSPVGRKAPANEKMFNISSVKWTSPYDGQVVSISGHMHNGGTHLRYYQNGQVLCDSKATYDPKNVAYIERANGLQGHNGMEHIAEMSSCVMPGRLKKGDIIHVEAEYDFANHMGDTTNKGQPGDIMGLGVMFFAPD
jgi:hypothetical protein